MTYEEPYIKTPKVGVLSLLKSSPFISSYSYWPWRMFIVLSFIIYAVTGLYEKFNLGIHMCQVKEWPETPKFSEYLHHISGISLTLIYAHTLISCNIGLDKIYILHIIAFKTIFLLPAIFGEIGFLIHLASKDPAFVPGRIGWGIVRIFDLVACIVLGIPTRVMYVKQYRKAVHDTNAPFNYIFSRLLIPWIIIFIIDLAITIPSFVIVVTDRDEAWFDQAGLGFLGVKCAVAAIQWFFELFMYFQINPNKSSFRYIICGHKGWFERAVITAVAMWTGLAILFSTLEIKGYKKAWPEGGSPNWEWYLRYFVIFSLYLFNGIRKIGLWYYAVSEWNLNDLSFNELEVELREKYGNDETDTSSFWKRLGENFPEKLGPR